MANDNVVRLITIRGKAEDLDKLAGEVKKVADAQGNLISVSERSTKATSDLDKMAERYQRRLDTQFRMNQDYAKSERDLTTLRDAGRITSERRNELLAIEAQRLGQTSALSNSFRQSLAGVQGQMVALSAGAGPVGTFLAGLGPWGLAAAVGLGAASSAFNTLSEMAHDFATKARELRDFAESTGLTITQIKALNIVGGQVGVDSERIAHGLESMTTKLEEFRNMQGSAFDLMYKYNSGLAIQLATTRSTTEAVALLSRAFANLDTTQRNALGRVMGFGRSPGDMVRVLNEMQQRGGLDAVSGGLSIDEEKYERIARLQIEIETRAKAAKSAIAGLWSEDILRVQREEIELLERAAKRMKEMAEAAGGSWWTNFWVQVGQALGGQQMIGAVPQPGEAETRGPQVRGTVPAGHGRGAGNYTLAPEMTAEAQLKLWERQNGILGSAMTLSEQYSQKVLQVAAAQDKDKFSTEVRNRVMAEFNLSQQKAILATRERFGIASEEQILNVRLAETYDQLRKAGLTSATDIAAAERMIRKEARDTYEQLQVRASSLPGLKQLELEAGRTDRMFDQFATGSLNNFSSGLADITMGTKSAKDGFRDLGLQVLRSLEEMLIKMMIVAPIAKGLQSSLGGFFNFGTGLVSMSPVSGATGVVGANGPLVTPTFHTGGIIGGDSLPSRYVHPAYFDSAPRFHAGGIAGNEVPIIANRGEGVFTPGQMAAMGGGGSTVNVNVSVDNRNGSEVSVQQSRNANGDVDLQVMIDHAVSHSIGSGRQDAALGARFGARATPRGR